MVQLQRISAEWNCPVVVAATGPSLTVDVAAKVRRARWPSEKCRVVAVNDAYRLLPYADVLYACDENWWTLHLDSVRKMFHGERWTTHEENLGGNGQHVNDKRALADAGLNFVRGRDGDVFSTDPGTIHYGSNSGFQAVNLAILKGATQVILVGFDMGGPGHFFGDHPAPLHNRSSYRDFIAPFRHAAKTCPVPIVNATPQSALDCFPRMDLDDALAETLCGPDGMSDRDRPESDASADRHCAA